MNTTKTLLSLILIGLISGGGYFGYQQYEKNQQEKTRQQEYATQRQKAIEVLKQGIPVLEKFNELNKTTPWLSEKVIKLFNPQIIQEEQEALVKIEQQPLLSTQNIAEIAHANNKYLPYNQFISQMIGKIQQINQEKDSIIKNSSCYSPFTCQTALTNAFIPDYIQGLNRLQQKQIIPPVHTADCSETEATNTQTQLSQQFTETQKSLTSLQEKTNSLTWFKDQTVLSKFVQDTQQKLNFEQQTFNNKPVEFVQFVCNSYQNTTNSLPMTSAYIQNVQKNISDAESLKNSNKLQSCATQHKEQCDAISSDYLMFEFIKSQRENSKAQSDYLKQQIEKEKLKRQEQASQTENNPMSGDEFAKKLTQGVVDINQSKNQEEANQKMKVLDQMLADNEKKVLAEPAKQP